MKVYPNGYRFRNYDEYEHKLHQPYREKLVPGLADIINNLKHVNGVIGTVLCGAGPSILIILLGSKSPLSNSSTLLGILTSLG